MRRFRPWTRFGEEGPTGLDLPARPARALALEHGWRAAAGERLADRVHAEGLRQGVLELTTAGKAWRDALLPALPALAARLAAMHPQLGVRKVRLRLQGETEVPAAVPVPGTPPRGEVARAASPPSRLPPERGRDQEEPWEVRLMRVAQGYLGRAGKG